MLYNETFYPVHANETFYSVQAPVYLTRQRRNVLAYLWHTWLTSYIRRITGLCHLSPISQYLIKDMVWIMCVCLGVWC